MSHFRSIGQAMQFATCCIMAVCLVSLSRPGSAQEDYRAHDPFGETYSIFVQAVGGPVGIKAYAPGRWGHVAVSITNRTPQDQVIQATVMVGGREDLRFSRDVLVPARTSRTTTIPIHVNESTSLDEPIELIGRVAGSDEIESYETTYLARILQPTAMAYITDRTQSSEEQFVPLDFGYEASLAMRGASGLSRQMTMIDERLLPSSIEGWDSLRYVILAGERLNENPATREAMRQWVSEGGRMWIQMNQSSPELARLLFGSTLDFQVVDRVQLNDFEILNGSRYGEGPPTVVTLEEPTELIRMFVENAEVMYSIDGWPAMFKIAFGRGEVYFTTLAPRGWIRSRAPGDPPYSDPSFYTDFVALEPLVDLSSSLRQPFADDPIPADVSTEFTQSRIGYSVPKRSWIVGSLLAFCGIIGVAALALGRVQKGEHLAWVTSVGGVVTAVVILSVGWASRREVPPTASSLQIVQMLPETSEYVASGEVAFFQSDSSAAAMGSSRHSRIDPQSAPLTGKFRNFVWNDASRWTWRETTLPPGVQIFQVNSRETTPRPIMALGKFGPGGLEGTVDLTSLGASDGKPSGGGLIVFPFSPAMAANIKEDGSFVAGFGDILAPGQFFNEALITENQRHQQAVYQAWYDHYIESLDPNPYLLTWYESLGTGLDWRDDVRVLDASLLVVPLKLLASDPGQLLEIPSPAIRMRAIPSAQGQSSTFANQRQQWIHPYARPSTTRIRFQLPSTTLPAVVGGVSLDVDCNIPSRTMEIHLLDGQNPDSVTPVLVASIKNASGRMTFGLPNDVRPTLDADGGLIFELSVGELLSEVEEQTMANSAWSIRSTALNISGKHSTSEAE
jgi:hypothetical protein